MEDSKNIIIQAKNARIIAILAEKFDGSLDKAMDVFYKSATAQMIQDGVADLHCRSDHYLADEIYREYSEWKSPVCVTPEAQVPLTLESKFRMTPIKS